MFREKKFRVVVLDNPIEILDNELCANLFGKTLQMKHIGYKATYGDKALPMDKSDFFSTHIIFCEEHNDELIPVTAYKATPYDRCLLYNFEFPGLSLMKTDGHPSCVDKIKEILETSEAPHTISYDSCWAQNLNYRFHSDPETKTMLREIIMMFIVKHHKEFNIPHMFTCGVVKVKTDQFFIRSGLTPLNENSLFQQKNLNNEDVVMFYSKEFSYEAIKMAEKYQKLWDEKLVINSASIHSGKIRKAA